MGRAGEGITAVHVVERIGVSVKGLPPAAPKPDASDALTRKVWSRNTYILSLPPSVGPVAETWPDRPGEPWSVAAKVGLRWGPFPASQ